TLLPPIKPAKPKPGEMPIALESLIVRNFQGIEKTELIGLPRAPWIFLTGNNGYGKSCVLRATFIGFHGKRDGDTELANGGTDIVLRYWDDEKVVTNSSAEAQSPSIAAYGPHRLEITDEISKEQRTDRSSASFSLFKTSGHLLNIEGYLRDWYTDPKRKSRYTTVVEMLKSLMPGIGDIFFDEDSRRILYCEKDTETGENLPPLDFLKLASGFKSIIAFVGDMCIRFFESNPSWSATHDFKGIVIVDELDLHLHPIWQRQLPTLLSTAFPKVQFIVSTHSPIPILGAPAGSILLTVDRTKEEGTQVERLDIDISTLLPNTILTSPIFGFQEIMPQSFDKRHQRIRTEASFQEMTLNDQVKKRLADYEKTDREAELLKVFT
ncbi:MAG: AAA family ATPase, partial [Saprospiraceae bacterium]